MQPFNTLPYTVQPSVASLTKPSEFPLTQFYSKTVTLWVLYCVYCTLHCADCLLYSLVITKQVMCVLYSTIALASLHNTCGSYLTIVILLRHLLHHAALL